MNERCVDSIDVKLYFSYFYVATQQNPRSIPMIVSTSEPVMLVLWITMGAVKVLPKDVNPKMIHQEVLRAKTEHVLINSIVYSQEFDSNTYVPPERDMAV